MYILAVNSPGFTCEPGKSFKSDCNTCRCHESGKFAACTLKACPREKRAIGDYI